MRPIALLFSAVLPLLAAQPSPRVESVTTETTNFAPGGTIVIEGSTGELNVEGWDQPSVEVIVTRYTWSGHAESARRELDRVQVGKPVVSGTQMTITARHRKSLGVHVDFRIRVPRDSSLIIHQGTGDVVVYDVGGNIDATATAGQLLLQLPASSQYAIDARNRAGGSIYSEFEGKSHSTWVLMGGRLESSAPASAHHLHLRVGYGGITIQKMAV